MVMVRRLMFDPQEAKVSRAAIDALGDEIALTACRLDAAQQVLLTHIRAFDQAGGWAWQGAKSCAAWLSWRIGCGRNAASERVRVANALGTLPLIDAAFGAGALSYCKVRAMTRVAMPDNEALLLDQARSTTGAELERICASVRQVLRPRDAPGDVSPPPHLRPRRRLPHRARRARRPVFRRPRRPPHRARAPAALPRRAALRCLRARRARARHRVHRRHLADPSRFSPP